MLLLLKESLAEQERLLQPFYDSLDFVRDNPGEPVAEETFTHSHLLWSSVIPYLLPPSFTIHSSLPVQFTCLTVFLNKNWMQTIDVSPRYSVPKLVGSKSDFGYFQLSEQHANGCVWLARYDFLL